MTTNDMRISSQHAGETATALGVASATLFVVGWAWDHQYVPVLFAAAPVVAVAGLAFAVVAIRRNERASVLAFAGGAVCVLVLLGYVYALLAHAGGGN
jgi:hypothetical protein